LNLRAQGRLSTEGGGVIRREQAISREEIGQSKGSHRETGVSHEISAAHQPASLGGDSFGVVHEIS
jgi:hypothetical protein